MDGQFYGLIGAYVATLGTLGWLLKNTVGNFTAYIANDKAHTNHALAELKEAVARLEVAVHELKEATVQTFGNIANALMKGR